MRVKVRATRIGLYGNTRHYPADSAHKRAGQPFYLEDVESVDKEGNKIIIPGEQHFSKSWMEKVEDESVKAVSIPKKARKPHGIPAPGDDSGNPVNRRSGGEVI